MNNTHPFVPIIIITAKPQQYDHAVELGVDALMEKPLNLPLLLATIAGFMAESETERLLCLTNPDFKTHYLSRQLESRSSGASQ
jgi:DNA-binding response OmpR family regulator